MSTLNGLTARIILCDYAQVSEMKLTMVGAGWSFTNPGPARFGVGIYLELDPRELSKAHSFELMLRDADGRPVNDPNGNPVRLTGMAAPHATPADHPIGMPMKVVQALNVVGLPLQPSTRYQVVLTVDNSMVVVEDFCTRAALQQLKAS